MSLNQLNKIVNEMLSGRRLDKIDEVERLRLYELVKQGKISKEQGREQYYTFVETRRK